MKKTTTRIATIAAVLVMSAFAIVLAQYDARQRDKSSDPVSIANLPAQASEPLDIQGVWPGENAIVRGNNERVVTRPEHGEIYANALRQEPQSLPALSENVGTETTMAPPNSQLNAAAEFGADLPNMPSNSEFPQSNLDGSYQLVATGNSGTDWSQGNAMGYDSAGPSLPNQDSDVVLATQEVQALPAWASGGKQMPALPGPNKPSSTQPNVPPPMATLNVPQPSGTPAATFQNTAPSFPPADPPRENVAMPAYGALPSTTSPNYPPAAGAGPTSPSPNSSISPGINPGMNPNTNPAVNTSTSQGFSSSSNQGLSSSMSQGLSSSLNAGPRAELVSNQPGSRYLDGSQNPILQIHKRAPEEIQVGKKATFVITVRNAGNAAAHEVTVIDRVPRGARFAESSPAISPTADGVLTWSLGEMGAGDERTINLQIIPEVEGEVGSVASVHFSAQASVRTIATSPQILLEIESIGPAIIGQSQQINVTVQNSGTGVAKAIRLEADIPTQLRHDSGETQLEALVGDLRPNESRRLTLNVAAVQPGQSQCVLRAVNDDGIQAEKTMAVDVRTPQLAATIAGPSLRYLERQANYQVVVTNTGTAMARNLDFVVHLPVGLKFVSVDIPQANYNPETHSINLGLAELDSNQSAPFTVSVLPVQLGPQVIRVNATGDLNTSAEAKAQVTVAGLAELTFKIGQDNGTVEVGATTTYFVEVSNVGNQADKNVQLAVQLPEGSNLLQVDAPVEYRAEADRLIFAPVAEMRNRDVKTFRFQVQHNRAGNQVVRSQLTSENWPVAVVKEEGTLVYNDQN